VHIVSTATADLRGVARLGWGLARGALPVGALQERFGRLPLGDGPPRGWAQAVRFAAIGVLSTVSYLLLFLLLRTFASAQVANAVALLVTAVGNTAANRRVTFGVRGPAGALGHQARGLVAFGAGLVLSAGALAVLHGADPHPAPATELVALVLANLAATVLRFLLYRVWVFREEPRPPSGGSLREPASSSVPEQSGLVRMAP
jgi:putative flippase GtrA